MILFSVPVPNFYILATILHENHFEILKLKNCIHEKKYPNKIILWIVLVYFQSYFPIFNTIYSAYFDVFQ